MEADIKVIRLIRKAVVEKPEETNLLDNSQSYFATDYFDIMQVEQKTLQTPMAELLDIGRVNFCVHEAAAQSYAL